MSDVTAKFDEDYKRASRIIGTELPVPRNDYILIFPEDKQKTAGTSIIIPDEAQDDTHQFGIVMRVGPGRILDSGNRTSMEIFEGDRVVFRARGLTKLFIMGEELYIVNETVVLLVWKQEYLKRK